MITTVEISNYPLTSDYETIILNFIERVQASGLKVKVNATSTHIQGDYDQVLDVLKTEMKHSFAQFGKMIFVVKFLKGELNLDFSM